MIFAKEGSDYFVFGRLNAAVVGITTYLNHLPNFLLQRKRAQFLLDPNAFIARKPLRPIGRNQSIWEKDSITEKNS
jgi:hypothetical protein